MGNLSCFAGSIHTDYAKKVRFHLDATHSFDPQKDAIQTLDDQFSAFKAGTQSLVVAINIGMLGNYSADGNPTHSDIKSAISKYLEPSEAQNPTCSFVDFRNYPKFKITSKHVDAQFIGQLLKRLVTSEAKNPFFVAFQRANPESQVARNFYLLQIAEVREKGLDVLLHAHLRYNQFLTAKTVLDFVHRILTGDGYLFDNIFCLSGSDLLDALQKLDPCTKRSKRLDLFRIRTKLELFDSEFLEFRDSAVEYLGTKSLDPSSRIRFFYLMHDVEIGNNYHQSIAADLKETLFDDYRHFGLAHSEYKLAGNAPLHSRVAEPVGNHIQSALEVLLNGDSQSRGPSRGQRSFRKLFMSSAAHFQTRARAIDHLGRGQIADCPTAVTELFKNAHDAYARNVSLHIFDGDPHFAAIFDDGCGMTADEIVSKWLVIGTESKIAGDIPTKDRFGLVERPRLGEKGIGRLSAGFLAPVTLLVTRRKNGAFAAALVDWRFFENPYLLVSDIEIPMEDFTSLRELPVVYQRLVRNSVANLSGKGVQSKADKTRVVDAWQQFSKDERKSDAEITTSAAIQELANASIDFDRAMSHWFENEKEENHGTAIFLINLRHELSAWFEESDDPEADEARMHLRGTLTGFVDPNTSKEREFSYYLQIHRKDSSTVIMDSDHEISTEYLQSLEHYVSGTISAEGWFSGNVTAFGINRGKCKFRVDVPNLVDMRGQSRVGEFTLEVATVEQVPKNSTHSEDELHAIKQRQEVAGGMMVYRDGVRVLPYGRPDNDFFGLEERRSKHAGREFWADRRVFGRVRISREGNPHLRDKAGREGLVENQAKRLMRQIVIEVLRTAARRYFGSGSPVRETELKAIQQRNERGKAAALEARRTRRGDYLSASRQVGAALRKFESILPDLQKQTREALKKPNPLQLSRLRAELGNAEQLLVEIHLPVLPKGLEDRTDEHRELRDRHESSREDVSLLYNEVSATLAECEGKRPERIVAAFQKKTSQELTLAITELLASVQKQSGDLELSWRKRLDAVASEFESATLPYIEQSANRESVAWATDQIRAQRVQLDTTVLLEARNAVQALKLLTQGIDLTIALEVVDESDVRANERIEQLNLLAQSGIAVELISHELEEMAQETESSLKRLPENCRATPAFKRAVNAFNALIDRFRFLAPLSVATYRTRRALRGAEIGEYVRKFFSRRFESSGIEFDSTDAFDSLEITDVPSRIFPVFINLVNNSVYWLKSSRQKKIRFDLKGGLVIVADSGPGIDKDDVDNLFQMFFTKRPQGRGIGLYLCRANLAVARHQIRIAGPEDPKVLSGANFVIAFRGLND